MQQQALVNLRIGMTTLLRRLAIVVALFGLSACGNLPRGAALQSEVLAAAQDDDPETIADFVVEHVTRASLSTYSDWPAIGENGRRWINRQAQSNNRIISAGDAIVVTVWDSDDNSLLTAPGQRFVTLPETQVSSSGFIFLPYLGNVKISGMSPDHARESIENRYLEVAPTVQVQLEMAEGQQSTVSLIGGVAAPGSYPLPNSNFTVLGLIAQAGGVSEGLENPQVRLIRGNEVFGTSIHRLFDNPGLDTTLRGGDKIYIEKDDRFFMSLGATGTEALHYFPKQHFTALEAMAVVGGVSDSRADPKGVLILREYPNSAVRSDRNGPAMRRVVFVIDLTNADGLFSAGNFHIRSGDLVYATESPVTQAQTIMGLIGGAFSIVRQGATIGG